MQIASQRLVVFGAILENEMVAKISPEFRARIGAVHVSRGANTRSRQIRRLTEASRQRRERLAYMAARPSEPVYHAPIVRTFTPSERLARRIAADPKFRAQYETAPKTLDQLQALIERRAGLTPKTLKTLIKLTVLGIATLPVSPGLADDLGIQIVRRGSDWRVLPSVDASRYVHTDGVTEWRGGQPKSYTRATNDTYVRAYACIARGALVGMIHETTFRLPAPAGYKWSGTVNGFALTAKFDGADYHVSADDVLTARDDDCAAICRRIEIGRAARLLAQQQAEADTAAMEILDAGQFWVCRADSLRAGNCMVGTDHWIARHGLDARRHYPGRAIRALSDDSRARLALMAAARRASIEAQAGVCLLADHGVAA